MTATILTPETRFEGEPLLPAPEPAMPRILVVDDSPVDRRLAGSIVEKQMGLRVSYARNGLAALAALQDGLPAAVLADLLMPEMDGLELVEAVRQQFPRVPVVLMTAHGSEDIALQALRAGAASYVPKKHLPRSLAPTLEQVLSAARSDRCKQRLLTCATAVEFHFTLENDPGLIPALVTHFQEYLGLLHASDQTERTQLGIALEEALLNGLYHGNLEIGQDSFQADEPEYYQLASARRVLPPYRDRRLRVFLRLTSSQMEAVIEDEGPGFDVGGWRVLSEPERLGEASGRGLVLIRQFMDEVTHNATGNRITMVKRCRRPPEEAA